MLVDLNHLFGKHAIRPKLFWSRLIDANLKNVDYYVLKFKAPSGGSLQSTLLVFESFMSVYLLFAILFPVAAHAFKQLSIFNCTFRIEQHVHVYFVPSAF